MKWRMILGLILICISLSSCKPVEAIYNNMYIASIGFEKNEDKVTGYFYLPSSIDISSTEKVDTDKPAEIAKIEGNSIVDVFRNLELTSFLKMNLKHVSSLVLHESVLNKKEIEELIDYTKNSNYLDYNFYFFVTRDKIEDIYSIENPNQESVMRTLLCEPISNYYTYTSAKPIHFLNFCRDYYEKKTIPIALLEISNVWKDETDSLVARGVGFIEGEKSLLVPYEEMDFSVLKTNKIIEYIDEFISVVFTNYSCKIKYEKDCTKIKIRSNYEVVSSRIDDTDSYILNIYNTKLQLIIDEYLSRIDFLNLSYNNHQDMDVRIEIDFNEK